MSVLRDVLLKDGYGNSVIPLVTPKADEPYNTAVGAFMDAFDAKAASLLMTNTSAAAPSGSGTTASTAHDLLKLTVAALGYDELNRIWSARTKTITTRNSVSRTITLTTTVTSSSFEDYYMLLAGKTGSMGTANALVVVGLCEDTLCAGAIIGAAQAGNRFPAMKELFDIAKIALNGGDTSGESVTNALGAAVCVVPRYPALYDARELETLFTQAASTVASQASVTKVLTAITALDYLKDLDELITMTEDDVAVGGSGAVFQTGDIVSYRDLLYAMMLPSSNMAAHALAHNVGNIILGQ